MLEQACFKFSKKEKIDFSILDIPDLPDGSDESPDNEKTSSSERNSVEENSESSSGIKQTDDAGPSSSNKETDEILTVADNNNLDSPIGKTQGDSIKNNNSRDNHDAIDGILNDAISDAIDYVDAKPKRVLSDLSVSYSPKELDSTEYNSEKWTTQVDDELSAVAVVDVDMKDSINTFKAPKKLTTAGSFVLVSSTPPGRR